MYRIALVQDMPMPDATMAALKAAASEAPATFQHIDALLDDGPMRAAARALESGPKTLLLTQR